jgi:hypothetical protein
MSDVSAPSTPSPAETDPQSDPAADPLACDWSEGLPGPLRPHGIPQPKLLALNGAIEAPPAGLAVDDGAQGDVAVEIQQPPGMIFDAEEVLRTSLTNDGPEPQPSEEAAAAAAIPEASAPAFEAEVASSPPASLAAPAAAAPAPADPEPEDVAPPPLSTASTLAPPADPPAPLPQDPAGSSPAGDDGPTPWSEPVEITEAPIDAMWETLAPGPSSDSKAVAEAAPTVPAEMAGWETPVPAPEAAASTDAWTATPAPPVPAPDETWSTGPAAEPVEEWQAEAPGADFERASRPDAGALPTAGAADWSSLRAGPDWATAVASAEPAIDAWGAAPPAPAQSEWSPAPPMPEPQAPSAATALATEWSAPAAEEPRPFGGPAPAWNAPAVGASALEQLESEPPEPEPGAANELFGTVPTGGMLAGDDEDPGPPQDLDSPEEVLRPLAIDHEDPDLPAVDERARTPTKRAQPLAAFKPAGLGALEVSGEHRVAVHTRGGRTLRGTLRGVDLSKSQFPLVPQGGGEPETIYHSDVKAIFFMLAPGEKGQAGDGAKVRVTFADGRSIEGIREGADAKHGFFLVPLDAARTNIRRIYVAREAISDVKET